MSAISFEKMAKIYNLLTATGNSARMGDIYTLIVLHYAGNNPNEENRLRFIHQVLNVLTARQVPAAKIADTIKALAMFEPPHAFQLLKSINKILNTPGVPPEWSAFSSIYDLARGKHYGLADAYPFIEGLLLGIFQTSNFMDSEYPNLATAEFEQELTQVIIDTILSSASTIYSSKASNALTLALGKYCQPIKYPKPGELSLKRINSLKEITRAIDQMAKPSLLQAPDLSDLLAHELCAKALSALNLRQKVTALSAALSTV